MIFEPKSPYKNILSILFLVGVVVGGIFIYNRYGGSEVEGPSEITEETDGENLPQGPSDYKDATYTIDGEAVTLVDGESEIDISNSNSTIVTSYFGNEVRHDVNGDGREDVVFLLTQETGGTGFFYYVVAALNTSNGYIGSQAYFLGDRIAPQTIEKGKGRIVIVNYTDRREGESFSTKPSVGKSVWLFLDAESLQFGIVEQNFAGEADPRRMFLQMKTWEWISALYNDGKEIKPVKSVFSITFTNDGKFTAKTDCNSVGGSYVASEDGQISFSQIYMTKMYCEGSQEAEFVKLLENTTSFHFTGKGELVLSLKFDSGSVIFR